MADLTTEDVADLVQSTLRDLDRGSWTDLTGDLQDYTAMRVLLKKEKVKFKTGNGARVNILTEDGQSARNVGLGYVATYNIKDGLSNGYVPWRHTTANYAFDRREEEINGGDAEQIVDLIKTRRGMCDIALAKKMETNFWGKPSDSTDVLTPWGVDMYIVRNATQGFNGGNPSGFTTGAVFDSSTVTRWKNWSDQYTTVSTSDLVRRIRLALKKTNFKSPAKVSEVRSISEKRSMYTNVDVIQELEELVPLQNDQVGNDLAKYDGDVLIKRIPLMWVPTLDTDTQDPVYGICWDTLVPVFLKGEYMKESKPRALDSQPTVVVVDKDMTYNFVCYDRRSHFIVNKA